MLPTNYFNALHNYEQIGELSMLIVGVGGIGCELLKVLCKMTLKSTHILDMDTIELSNLNRQFLFKAEHKGQSKALIAKQAIKKINPYFNIEAHHKNIREQPIDFFKQFNFLVMALDNIEARNYVNKVGVRLGIPVIDAGTLGYKGNVRLIIPGITSCYSCEPKVSSQKSFPVCTIRMRPEKPIHCIVWAKMLFEVFFSDKEINNDMKDLSALAQQGQQTSILLQLLNKEIIAIKEAKVESDNIITKDYILKIQPISEEDILASNNNNPESIDNFDDFQSSTVSVNDLIALAKASFARLIHQKKEEGFVLFQKDDDNIIHFISSMANLRMKCFGIEQQSFNQVKNMAGNIVPAIASTNSIASGLEVVEMLKYYFHNTESLRSYYIQNQSQKIRALRMERPFENCQVCSQSAKPVIIEADFVTTSFGKIVDFLSNLLRDLVNEFSINFGSTQLYNSEQPNEIMKGRKISEIGGSTLEIELTVSDEEHSETICKVWVIHADGQDLWRYQNTEQIKTNLKENARKREEIENAAIQESVENEKQSDMILMGEEHEINDLEIIKINNTGEAVKQQRAILIEQNNEEVVVDKVEKKPKTA